VVATTIGDRTVTTAIFLVILQETMEIGEYLDKEGGLIIMDKVI